MLHAYSVNGQVGASLYVEDRAYQYGDGVFETIAFFKQKPVLWKAHMERLARGCDALGLSCPSEDALLAEAQSLMPQSDSLVVKFIVSRCEGGRGYRPPTIKKANVSVLCYGLTQPTESGNLHTRACKTPWSINPVFAGLKTLNRLEQVLAQKECADWGIEEAVMTDGGDKLISGTKSNLFILEGDRLVTPELNLTGIAGTMRAHLLECSKQYGLQSTTSNISHERMKLADGAFFVNSVMGVLPIQSFEGVTYQNMSQVISLQKLIHKGLHFPCL